MCSNDSCGDGNSIGDDSAEVLSEALEKNSAVTHIILDGIAGHANGTRTTHCTGTQIETAGAIRLSEMLQKNSTITAFSMECIRQKKRRHR